MEVLRQEDWTQEVTNRLRSFEKSLIIALKEKGWDGKESEETVTWTFAGGLFYSITVITTIGIRPNFCFLSHYACIVCSSTLVPCRIYVKYVRMDVKNRKSSGCD